MFEWIAGNAFSLFATVTDGLSTRRKSVRSMLLVQVISQIFYCTSAILLKGYSAAVQNGVSILRNLLGAGKKTIPAAEWLLVAVAVGLGLYFNNLGLLGLLPVAANLEYSVSVFVFRNRERALKISFLISVFLFGIFNFSIYNITGGITNIALFAATLVMMIRNEKQEKIQAEKGAEEA